MNNLEKYRQKTLLNLLLSILGILCCLGLGILLFYLFYFGHYSQYKNEWWSNLLILISFALILAPLAYLKDRVIEYNRYFNEELNKIIAASYDKKDSLIDDYSLFLDKISFTLHRKGVIKDHKLVYFTILKINDLKDMETPFVLTSFSKFERFKRSLKTKKPQTLNEEFYYYFSYFSENIHKDHQLSENLMRFLISLKKEYAKEILVTYSAFHLIVEIKNPFLDFKILNKRKNTLYQKSILSILELIKLF